MAKSKVSSFEELYCQSYILSGGKKSKAYEDAGYSIIQIMVKSWLCQILKKRVSMIINQGRADDE